MIKLICPYCMSADIKYIGEKMTEEERMDMFDEEPEEWFECNECDKEFTFQELQYE